MFRSQTWSGTAGSATNRGVSRLSPFLALAAGTHLSASWCNFDPKLVRERLFVKSDGSCDPKRLTREFFGRRSPGCALPAFLCHRSARGNERVSVTTCPRQPHRLPRLLADCCWDADPPAGSPPGRAGIYDRSYGFTTIGGEKCGFLSGYVGAPPVDKALQLDVERLAPAVRVGKGCP